VSNEKVRIDRIDHLILWARDVPATCDFYQRVLGMEVVRYEGGRSALAFGRQKINVEQAWGEPASTEGRRPEGLHLCLIADGPLAEVEAQLQACGVPLEFGGRVRRSGALGPIESLYFRDPEGNSIEVSAYSDSA
jgi:catechol 2,3-dioxygenase-like lactoylglutathione lyase family enzyme